MTPQGHRPSQDTVNRTELLARVDDHEMLCELIVIFKEDFPQLLLSLQQAVAREDMKNVEAASHALKGMLRMLSVTQAAVTASRLEWMGREGKTPGMAGALTLLENQVADLLPELDTYTVKAKP